MSVEIGKFDKRRTEADPDPIRFVFEQQIHFRSVDGNFDVLPKKDRILTSEDIRNGFLSSGEKISVSFSRLLDGLSADLYTPSEQMSAERKRVVDSILQGNATFIPLDVARVDPAFSNAAATFEGAQPGVILFPVTESILNQFSAIQFSDGRIARLMHGHNVEDLEEFTAQLNNVAPKIEAHAFDKNQVAYAVEFIEGAECPKTVSMHEIEDWLNRVRESRLLFEFDVSAEDPSLDNFVRKDGRLFWVDGNIMRARTAETPEALEEFIVKQKGILEKFLER